MSEKWEGKSRGGIGGYMFFIYVIRLCGIHVAYAFLSLIVLYFIPFAPKATRSIWTYCRKICKLNRIKSVQLLITNYYRLGQILIDKVAIQNGMRDKYHFVFENYTQFLEILNGDDGVIMIGAHVGNWEIGVPFFDHYGKKINIVMFDNEHRQIKELLKKNNKLLPEFKVIPIREDNLEHIFKISEALNNHEYVCFQGDRYLNEHKLLETEFMGTKALFPCGSFVLASKLKKTVVFYFAMREPKRTYRFHFYVVPPSSEYRKEGHKWLLEQYKTTLESILKKYPEQWFNYYDFWNIENSAT